MKKGAPPGIALVAISAFVLPVIFVLYNSWFTFADTYIWEYFSTAYLAVDCVIFVGGLLFLVRAYKFYTLVAIGAFIGILIGMLTWPQPVTYASCSDGGICTYGSASSGDFMTSNLTLTYYPNGNEAWEDAMWQFYEASVPYQKSLHLNFTYNPVGFSSLDLDMRLYIPADEVPWDLTREGLEFADPFDNSQTRGTSAMEEVSYYNSQYLNGRTVYVLLFVYSGFGRANITLESNFEVTAIAHSDIPVGGLEGWVSDNFILVIAGLGALLGGLVAVVVVMHRRYARRIQAEKEKVSVEKLGSKDAARDERGRRKNR